MLFFCFFFFKQKTAYEMRISDWSSDVCSSDLMVPFYDSWMLIETQDLTILNVNDCILETPERLQTIKRHVSRCDILFTQFSYANWEDRRDNPQARRDLAAEKIGRAHV